MDESAISVKSADRALAVLEWLAEDGASSTLGEIAVALSIPRSSLHGLLRTMLHRGWLSVVENESGYRFSVGARALTVGASYLVNDDIVRRVADLLDSLSEQLGETIHLGVLDNSDIVYLAKRDAAHSLRLVSSVGSRLPAYATALGKVLIAELAEKELAVLLAQRRAPLTSRTLVGESELLADLAKTKRRGYAIDDQESTEGVRCFAVPLGHQHPRHHAISCSAPIARLDARRERTIIDALRASAASFPDAVGVLPLQATR